MKRNNKEGTFGKRLLHLLGISHETDNVLAHYILLIRNSIQNRVRRRAPFIDCNQCLGHAKVKNAHIFRFHAKLHPANAS